MNLCRWRAGLGVDRLRVGWWCSVTADRKKEAKTYEVEKERNGRITSNVDDEKGETI